MDSADSREEDFQELNPYAAPQAEPLDASEQMPGERPRYKWYSPGAVALATFLGSIMAGAVLLALNYRRAGRHGLAIRTIGFSALAFVILIVASEFLSEFAGDSLLYTVAQTLVVYNLAIRLQDDLLLEHQRARGKLASMWAAAGIGLLVAIGVGVLLIVVFTMLEYYTVGAEIDGFGAIAPRVRYLR